MRRPPDTAIAAAWFTPSQIARMAHEERQAVEFRRMLRQRDSFELRVREAAGPLSEEQLRALWALADREAKGATDD